MYYLYIGYYVDNQSFDLILKEKINNMSPARQKFEFNIIRGLSESLGDNIDYVSYVPTNGKIVLPRQSELFGAKIDHIHINKESYKSLYAAEKEFMALLKSLGEEKLKDLCVIMYAVNPTFLRPLLKLRKKYSVKLVTICSEVPALRRYGTSMIAKIKKRILTYYNEKFDGYIFFSERMKEVVNLYQKPYFVLEGIAPEITGHPMTGKRNIVMYAGGLAKDNKIQLLVDVCKEISELDELWICGAGADQEYVKNAMRQNQKIKYFGRLSNDEVVKLEQKAKVLVNLRSPDEELTNYSFPSKILEYISSGSLVLSTKLGGIPLEYFDYIVAVNGLTFENIKMELKQIFSMSDENYVKKCRDAQKFIIQEKNYRKQAKKIINFCKGI